MEDWQRKEDEYKQGIAARQEAMTELRRTFRELEWWPELEGARRQFDESPAFHSFRDKIASFAQSGDMAQFMAQAFWNEHIPENYPKPAWYVPMDESMIPFPYMRAATAESEEQRQNDRGAALAEIRADVTAFKTTLRERFEAISEDSYVSRLEARHALSFVTQFEGSISAAKPGDDVDLRRVGINYGYDPEAAFTDQRAGLDYVPAIVAEKLQYENDIRMIRPFIDRLRDAGIDVRREFREMGHDAVDPQIIRSDQVSLNRYLDLKTEAPALVDVIVSIGMKRLWLENQYERFYEDKPDAAAKADREMSFLQNLENKLLVSVPGDLVDLRVAAVNAENFLAVRPENLPGVSLVHAGDMSKAEYQERLAGLEKDIRHLEEAGITVRTGFRKVTAKDLVAAQNSELSVPTQSRDAVSEQSLPIKGTLEHAQKRDAVVPDADQYWARVAQSASTYRAAGQSQNLDQTQHRGRGM